MTKKVLYLGVCYTSTCDNRSDRNTGVRPRGLVYVPTTAARPQPTRSDTPPARCVPCGCPVGPTPPSARPRPQPRAEGSVFSPDDPPHHPQMGDRPTAVSGPDLVTRSMPRVSLLGREEWSHGRGTWTRTSHTRPRGDVGGPVRTGVPLDPGSPRSDSTVEGAPKGSRRTTRRAYLSRSQRKEPFVVTWKRPKTSETPDW